MSRARGALGCAVAAALLACSGGRDVVPPSRDVVAGAQAGTQAGGDGAGYAYVARRARSVVALAEARGIEDAVARAAVDRLADVLGACIAGQARSGGAPDGAARVVAQIDATGAVANASLRVDPKSGVAATAVLCLLSPAKSLTFPPAQGGDRGIAIEALWGR